MMDSTLILLQSDDDWRAYKHRMLQQNGLEDSDIIWGKGPQSMPCMVSGFIMNKDRSPGAQLVCCYVYVEQALKLAKAAKVWDPNPEKPRPVNTIGVEQSTFNEAILANMSAVIKILVKTGITSEGHYLPILNAELQAIEQQHSQDLADLLPRLKDSVKKKDSSDA